MVTVGMGDVNRRSILAALDYPIYQLLGMLHGQKRIDEDGITLAINKCDGIRNPSQIFLARRESLGRATALLCQKLPVQPSHILLSHSVGILTMPHAWQDFGSREHGSLPGATRCR